MPTYEYECSQCGRTFEHFQPITSQALTDCILEDCNAKGTVRRLISSGGGVIFKGSGFYQTDYKGGNASAPGAKTAPCGSPTCSATGTSEAPAGCPAANKD